MAGFGRGQKIPDLAHEQPAVGQSGQLVVQSQVIDHGLGAARIGHVLERTEHARRLQRVLFFGPLAGHGDDAFAHRRVVMQPELQVQLATRFANSQKRLPHAVAITRMNHGQQVRQRRGWIGLAPEEGGSIVRPLQLVVVGCPDPETQAGNALRCCLALAHTAHLAVQFAAAQGIAHPLRQQRKIDGFGDEVGGPGVEGALDRFKVFAARQHDDGCGVAIQLPDQRTGLEAIHAGHLHVHQHQIRPVGGEGIDTFLPIGCQQHLVAMLAQNGLHQLSRGGVVIHRKQCRGTWVV